MMEIDVHPWDQVAIDEIAGVVYAARRAALEQQGTSHEALVRLLQEDLGKAAMRFVVAREDIKLAGFLVLAPMTLTTLSLNPGQALGSFPLVLPYLQTSSTAIALVKRAIEWAGKEGYQQIELMVPFAPDERTDPAVASWYRPLGFVTELSYVDMICDLVQQTTLDPAVPAGLALRPLKGVNNDELYDCYYAAFRAGDAQFFHAQTDQERRAYFETLDLVEARDEAASDPPPGSAPPGDRGLFLSPAAASRHPAWARHHRRRTSAPGPPGGHGPPLPAPRPADGRGRRCDRSAHGSRPPPGPGARGCPAAPRCAR